MFVPLQWTCHDIVSSYTDSLRETMSLCFDCCVLSGRRLRDGPITRPEESYRLCVCVRTCVCVCVIVIRWKSNRIHLKCVSRSGQNMKESKHKIWNLPVFFPFIFLIFLLFSSPLLQRAVSLDLHQRYVINHHRSPVQPLTATTASLYTYHHKKFSFHLRVPRNRCFMCVLSLSLSLSVYIYIYDASFPVDSAFF